METSSSFCTFHVELHKTVCLLGDVNPPLLTVTGEKQNIRCVSLGLLGKDRDGLLPACTLGGWV